MLYLVSDYKNPYFNIALEEYLFSSDDFGDDIIIVWRNEESIFLGKNQNPYVEIEHSLINNRKIPLLRRISGGGTVYHDLGNVNITFIQKNIKLDQIDFMKYTRFMQEMLISFGIDATYSDRKDLLVDGKKVSGSAQCIRGNKCLYHSTLLFDANLDRLNTYLNSRKTAKSNATKSVRSDVTNLNQYLNCSVKEFIDMIERYVVLKEKNSQKIILEEDNFVKINENLENLYSNDEWIFEKTPKFNICAENEDDLNIYVEVNRWRIKSFKITYKDSVGQIQERMLERLIGELFFEKNVLEIVKRDYVEYIGEISDLF